MRVTLERSRSLFGACSVIVELSIRAVIQTNGGCRRNRAHLGEARRKGARSPQRCHGALHCARQTGDIREKTRHINAAGGDTIINEQTMTRGWGVAACINIYSGVDGGYFLFGTLVVSCGDDVPAGTVVILYAVGSTAVSSV